MLRHPRNLDLSRAPAQARARAHLLALVEEMGLAPGDRLPPIRSLAAGAGTTYVSMHKAVRCLVQEGVVSAKPGVGIRVCAGHTRSGARGELSAGPPERARKVSLQQALRRDVLRGRFPFGTPLPLLKELTARYGSCSVTLRKALNALVEEELLELFGRGYRARGAARLAERNVVAFLVPPERSYSATAIRTISRSIHLEAAAAGVQLFTIPFSGYRHDARDCREVVRAIDNKGFRSRLLGVIGCNVTGEHSSFGDLLPHLRSLQVPVALADDTAAAPYGDAAGCPGLRWFSAGCTPRCGEVVGGYLVEAGHRSIAYITIDLDKPFSPVRYAGVQRVAAAGGAVLHRVAPLLEHARTAFRSGLWSKVWPSVLGTLASRRVSGLLPQSVIKAIEGAYSGALYDALDLHAMGSLLRPMLTRALDELDATVWVAENDMTALLCQQFLREHGAAAPERVALVGFDDSPEAAANDLTSYNFNAPGIVRAMLQYVLHPRQARRRSGYAPVDIDGYVVERGSAPGRAG